MSMGLLSRARTVLPVEKVRRKRFFVPAEHGAWVWWISPLILGAAAARSVTPALGVTALAALVAFLLRQPVTLFVKALAGRRPAGDRAPAAFWAGVYGFALLLLAGVLASMGHFRVLVLGLAGGPLFARYLWLVVRRSERRRLGMDLAATGVLALAAPAAYWSADGVGLASAALVWGVAWAHTGVSAVQVILRLPRRQVSPRLARVAPALPTVLNGSTLVIAGVLAWLGYLPGLVAGAFVVPVIDAVLFALYPKEGLAPQAVGLRQLAVSSVFTVIAALGFLV